MFVANFDALAQASEFRNERRNVVFLCWMQDSNQGLWNQTSSRLNASWKTDWAIEDQAEKNLNSIVRLYDRRVFSPLDPTAGWLSHLARAIYMFVVFNFDALAHASDFKSKEDKLSSSAEFRIQTRASGAESPANWMPADTDIHTRVHACIYIHLPNLYTEPLRTSDSISRDIPNFCIWVCFTEVTTFYSNFICVNFGCTLQNYSSRFYFYTTTAFIL